LQALAEDRRGCECFLAGSCRSMANCKLEHMRQIRKNFPAIAQALIIAVEGLEDIRQNGDCESSYNQCGFLSSQTLNRIRSLPIS
jgi:hypothetical protein